MVCTGVTVEVGQEKLKAVSEFPEPTSVKRFREFVGLANYFWFLIPNFARFANVMTDLTKKTSGYTDGELPPKSLQAFNYLKSALVAEPLVFSLIPDVHIIFPLTLQLVMKIIQVDLVQCLLSNGLMVWSM